VCVCVCVCVSVCVHVRVCVFNKNFVISTYFTSDTETGDVINKVNE